MRKLLALVMLLALASPAFAQVGNNGIANEGVTGTTLNKLAKLTTASPSTAIITTAGDTTGIVGVVVGNAGTTGNPIIAWGGQAVCAFDGTATAGHYVQNSGTVNGDCHDTGSTAEPTTGDTIGRVVIGGSGAGNYTVNLALSPSPAAGSGTVTNSGTLTSGQVATGAGTTVVQVDANAALAAGALTLGASGTAGSVAMGNATSGTVTLQPVAGALGTVTASLPANTGTIAELNLAQTFTAAQSFGEAHGTAYAPTLTTNNYNAVIGDCGKTLLLPTGTTPTVTLPNINPASGECTIKMVQTTAGTSLYTIQAASGGTLVSANSYTHTAKQWATIMLTLLVPSNSAATWGLAGEGS